MTVFDFRKFVMKERLASLEKIVVFYSNIQVIVIDSGSSTKKMLITA